MDREEIIRIAREAGFTEGDISLFPDLIAHFAALVAAHEREACAKAVEDYSGAWDDEGYALATAIRSRGQQ